MIDYWDRLLAHSLMLPHYCYRLLKTSMEIPPAEPKAESYLCNCWSILTSGCSTVGEKKANSSMNYIEPTCRWQLSKPLMHEYQLKLLMNDLTHRVRQLSYLNRSPNVYTRKLLLYLDDDFGLFLYPIALNLSTECLLSTCGINIFIH